MVSGAPLVLPANAAARPGRRAISYSPRSVMQWVRSAVSLMQRSIRKRNRLVGMPDYTVHNDLCGLTGLLCAGGIPFNGQKCSVGRAKRGKAFDSHPTPEPLNQPQTATVLGRQGRWAVLRPG